MTTDTLIAGAPSVVVPSTLPVGSKTPLASFSADPHAADAADEGTEIHLNGYAMDNSLDNAMRAFVRSIRNHYGSKIADVVGKSAMISAEIVKADEADLYESGGDLTEYWVALYDDLPDEFATTDVVFTRII